MLRSGFSKDCNCCRESGYRERTITLQSCYDQVRPGDWGHHDDDDDDQDGHRIESGSAASMQVTIKEPSGCKCYKCGSALP